MLNLVAKPRKAAEVFLWRPIPRKIPSDHEDIMRGKFSPQNRIEILINCGRFPINKTQKIRFLTIFSLFKIHKF